MNAILLRPGTEGHLTPPGGHDPDDPLAPGGSETDWVSAAPFRAHLRRLVHDTGLPWRAVALYAGVPPGLVRSLLLGRRGRPVRQVHPRAARSLLRVGYAELVELGSRRGSGVRVHRVVTLLAAGGTSAEQLAGLTGVSVTQAHAWLQAPPGWVSRRTELLVQALGQARGVAEDTNLPDGPTPGTAAATGRRAGRPGVAAA